MSSDYAEEYRQFVNSLQREEHRPVALNEIKNLITYKPIGETTNTLLGVGLNKIIQCLNDANKFHVDLTCEVLKMCFEKFNVGDVIKNYTPNIMYLLRHEKVCVRRLAVDEVYKTVTLDPCILPMKDYIDVFVAVAQMVIDQDVGIANRSILITSNLPDEAYPKVLEEMKIALQCNQSSKCNALEVVVNISNRSSNLMQLCVDMGYINFMVFEIESDDILYHVNILELLSRFATTLHGIAYLVKSGLLSRIANKVTDLRCTSLFNLVAPGYLKFLGSIAHEYPRELFEKYPVLVDLLFEALNSDDLTIKPVALDTLEFVGSTVEGKLSLIAIGSKFTQAIAEISRLIRNSTTEMKIRALNCFASLISIDQDPTSTSGPVDQRVTLMTREWFRSLSNNPSSMALVYENCKNPFPDIRLAGFKLLDATCQHQWGIELVSQVAGFVEYLLDRKVDYTKEAKEAKFRVIQKLSRSSIFHENITSRLLIYAEQGPFYSETEMQVAMQEDGN